LIKETADKIACRYPDSVLLAGDMAGPHGGRIYGHHSHRTGLDVDFAYFTTDMRGNPQKGFPLKIYDRFGLSVKKSDVQQFDAARNWTLVESLLTSKNAQIQWIFVSRGLKARLLRWALNHNVDLKLIEKAVSVLHQPGDSAPHNDHFHVRIFCPKTNAACHWGPPVWPWIKRKQRSVYTDSQLVRLATEPI
jgi:penicillin-insensitive murein endopeptidase